MLLLGLVANTKQRQKNKTRVFRFCFSKTRREAPLMPGQRLDYDGRAVDQAGNPVYLKFPSLLERGLESLNFPVLDLSVLGPYTLKCMHTSPEVLDDKYTASVLGLLDKFSGGCAKAVAATSLSRFFQQ